MKRDPPDQVRTQTAGTKAGACANGLLLGFSASSMYPWGKRQDSPLHWQRAYLSRNAGIESKFAEFMGAAVFWKNAKRKGALRVKSSLPQGRKSKLGGIDLWIGVVFLVGASVRCQISDLPWGNYLQAYRWVCSAGIWNYTLIWVDRLVDH